MSPEEKSITIENTQKLDAAQAFVAKVERLFGTADVEGILDIFSDTPTVYFADFPQFTGKSALRSFLEARFARQRGYTLTKRLRMLSGEMIGNYWYGEWEDARTGAMMCGRGTEFWTLEDGKIAIWEATFNVWNLNGAPVSPLV